MVLVTNNHLTGESEHMTSRDINSANTLRLKMVEKTRLERLKLEWKRRADLELLTAGAGILIVITAGWILI